MRKVLVILLAIVCIFGTFSLAPAELRDNGDGTITQVRSDGSWRMWIKDANTAMTLGYDSDGKMTWDQAMAFIDYLNSINYLNYNDWRLPLTSPVNGTNWVTDTTCDGSTDVGYYITVPGNEMSYMYSLLSG